VCYKRYVGAAALLEIHHNDKKANFSKCNNPKKNSRPAIGIKIGSLQR
jgi:hypothetical protein